MNKLILSVFMLLSVSKSNGQTYRNSDSVKLRSQKPIEFSIQRWDDGGVSAYLRSGSDTLEILRPDKIRFIKIGSRVYKIEDPVLTEVINLESWHWPNRLRVVDTMSMLSRYK